MMLMNDRKRKSISIVCSLDVVAIGVHTVPAKVYAQISSGSIFTHSVNKTMCNTIQLVERERIHEITVVDQKSTG